MKKKKLNTKSLPTNSLPNAFRNSNPARPQLHRSLHRPIAAGQEDRRLRLLPAHPADGGRRRVLRLHRVHRVHAAEQQRTSSVYAQRSRAPPRQRQGHGRRRPVVGGPPSHRLPAARGRRGRAGAARSAGGAAGVRGTAARVPAGGGQLRFGGVQRDWQVSTADVPD